MSTITKEQLIERLQHIISVASGFPESEKAQIDLELARIALASLESVAAPVAPDEMPAHIGPREFGRPQAYIDGWNACRAAMLQDFEPETDNTNQQFESLSRGDK